MVTTIQVDEKLKDKLDKLKIHRRETYNELIFRLIENCSPDLAERESLIATIETLSNPDEMRDIAEGIEAFNRGEGIPLEQLKKELGDK